MWLCISSTPWTMSTKAIGGYGRKIDDTSVSHDAPDWWHIPEVMDHTPQIGMVSLAPVPKINNLLEERGSEALSRKW